jgi:hypothetical protein
MGSSRSFLENPNFAQNEMYGAADDGGQFVEAEVHEVNLALHDEPEGCCYVCG